MSNILEALRKAQDEKSRTADQVITGREALIAHRTTRSWSDTNKRVIWLICSGAVLLATMGWLLYGPSKPASESKATLTAAAPVNMPAEPPQQVPPPAPPVPAAATAPLPAPPVPAIQVPVQLPAPPQANDDEENLPRRRQRAPANPPPAAHSQAAQPSRSAEATVSGVPEGVKLTGIAWQDSRKMRRAVINDLLVGEGAVVAGAKVLEIRPALVRFEKNGTVFEAVLPR